MAFWIFKTEPSEYSWDDLERDGIGCWDGVRNYQARNNLQSVRKGDEVFVYHTGNQKCLVGIAHVVRAAYPDPSDDTDTWVAVDVKATMTFRSILTLDVMRRSPDLADLALFRQGRLSVVPVTESEAQIIIALVSKD